MALLSKQESWTELPFPSPWDLPDPGIEPISPILAGGFFTAEPPGKSKVEFKNIQLICVEKEEKANGHGLSDFVVGVNFIDLKIYSIWLCSWKISILKTLLCV